MFSTSVEAHLDALAFISPNRIVVATDLSDPDYLLPHAIAQAKACAATLYLLHVIPSFPSSSLVDAVYLVTEIAQAKEQKALRAAQHVLGATAERVRAASVECKIVIRHGHITEETIRVMQHLPAGRLILGTHGHRHLKKFFLGSNALDILKNSAVPVWTVGPHARLTAHGRPARILHPVSLSSNYQQTAKVAIQLAQFYQAEVTLLHVLPKTALVEGSRQSLMDQARIAVGRLVPDETKAIARIVIQGGDTAERIVRTAEEMQADVVVLGSNPDTAFWPVHGDRIVYDVISEATCPVLTLRHAKKAIVS